MRTEVTIEISWIMLLLSAAVKLVLTSELAWLLIMLSDYILLIFSSVETEGVAANAIQKRFVCYGKCSNNKSVCSFAYKNYEIIKDFKFGIWRYVKMWSFRGHGYHLCLASVNRQNGHTVYTVPSQSVITHRDWNSHSCYSDIFHKKF